MHAAVDFLRAESLSRPVAEVLADLFRKQIMDGAYLPGERLIEAELVKFYGVSRGPVREAIRFLIAEGLVEAEKHRSPTVKGVGPEQFVQMFQVRGVLEAYAASLAAVKAGASQAIRREIATTAEKWRSGALRRSPSVFVEANTAFHARVLELADQDILTAQVRQLAIPGYKAVFKPLIQQDEMIRSSIDHAGILDAIAVGEAAGAERLMRDHVHRSGERIAAKFSPRVFDERLKRLKSLDAATV